MRLKVLQERAGPGFDQGDESERLLVHAYRVDDGEKRPLCGKDLRPINVVVSEDLWDAPLDPYDRCAECARIAVEAQV